MSLLREIQDGAASDNVSASVVLRKCKILAARLKSQEFAQWIDLELNGYNENVDIPAYRILHQPQNKGNFHGAFGRGFINADIPSMVFPDEIREIVTEDHEIRTSVNHLEDLLISNEAVGFRIPWPSDLVILIAQFDLGIYPGCQCLQMWRVLPRGKVINILGQVRSRILNFALDIEEQNPEAGEAPMNSIPVPEPIVQHIFNQHFHAAVGNMATGSQHFSQQATIGQTFTHQSLVIDPVALAQELPRLRQALVDEAEDPKHYEIVGAVRTAEIEASKPEDEQEQSKIMQSLARAGQWAFDTATKIDTTVAAEAIKQSMGLGS